MWRDLFLIAVLAFRKKLAFSSTARQGIQCAWRQGDSPIFAGTKIGTVPEFPPGVAQGDSPRIPNSEFAANLRYFADGENTDHILFCRRAQRRPARGQPDPAVASRRGGRRTVGYGGPNMAAAGCRLHADLTALAVMWFARAILESAHVLGVGEPGGPLFSPSSPGRRGADRLSGVQLVDRRRAKVHGIPVYYYMPPQIWAWAQWRVEKMRRLVDHVLCNLPFEEAWLRRHGCHATLVGHPFFDAVGRRLLDERFLADQRGRPGPLVLILPGSRTQEVSHNLPWFLKAAARVRQAVPAARFAVGAFRDDQAEMVRRALAKGGRAKGRRRGRRHPRSSSGFPFVPADVDVYVGKTPELMHLADCCMACSGSVSLELLYHATPTVILYWISRSAYFVQGFFRKAKYITLVNLLAGEDEGREVFPEYLTCQDRSAEIRPAPDPVAHGRGGAAGPGGGAGAAQREGGPQRGLGAGG